VGAFEVTDVVVVVVGEVAGGVGTVGLKAGGGGLGEVWHGGSDWPWSGSKATAPVGAMNDTSVAFALIVIHTSMGGPFIGGGSLESQSLPSKMIWPPQRMGRL